MRRPAPAPARDDAPRLVPVYDYRGWLALWRVAGGGWVRVWAGDVPGGLHGERLDALVAGLAGRLPAPPEPCPAGPAPAAAGGVGAVGDAVAALVALGYGRRAAEGMVAGVAGADGMPAEAVVRAALAARAGRAVA